MCGVLSCEVHEGGVGLRIAARGAGEVSACARVESRNNDGFYLALSGFQTCYSPGPGAVPESSLIKSTNVIQSDVSPSCSSSACSVSELPTGGHSFMADYRIEPDGTVVMFLSSEQQRGHLGRIQRLAQDLHLRPNMTQPSLFGLARAKASHSRGRNFWRRLPKYCGIL
jgi:hypothetical protein